MPQRRPLLVRQHGATLAGVSDSEMSAEISDVVRRPSRLRALAELGANAQSSAEALDRIARVACRVLDVPVLGTIPKV